MRQQQLGLEFARAQRPRQSEFQEHVVPFERRQSLDFEGLLDFAKGSVVRANEAGPGEYDGVRGSSEPSSSRPRRASTSIESRSTSPRKPAWFLALSPTGKVPVLRVTDAHGTEHALFESAAICEYLDETSPGTLLPADPLGRARHRAWIEFASGTLSDIAGLYTAPDSGAFGAKQETLARRFGPLGGALRGPWFGGDAFGLVDAAFGPVFRYLDAFEQLAGVYVAGGSQEVRAWRAALAARPSVAGAVGPDYRDRLAAFLLARGSHLSRLIAKRTTAAA